MRDNGCPSCTMSVQEIGSLQPIYNADVTFALVSRAPLQRLDAYRERMGWSYPWYSSAGSRFNYDFNATGNGDDEIPGMSVFLRDGDKVYHTYSTGQRGVEPVILTYDMLDMTPYGRQEDWEASPAGWPQHPTYG